MLTIISSPFICKTSSQTKQNNHPHIPKTVINILNTLSNNVLNNYNLYISIQTIDTPLPTLHHIRKNGIISGGNRSPRTHRPPQRNKKKSLTTVQKNLKNSTTSNSRRWKTHHNCSKIHELCCK